MKLDSKTHLAPVLINVLVAGTKYLRKVSSGSKRVDLKLREYSWSWQKQGTVGHIAFSQKAEHSEYWGSAPFQHFIQSEILAFGIVLATLGWLSHLINPTQKISSIHAQWLKILSSW